MTAIPYTDPSANPSSTSTAESPARIRALPHAGMAGPRWSALCALQAAIARREPSTINALVLEAFPTHRSILDFEIAHRQARWPGSYGDSPVQHVADIATAFVHGRHLDQRGFIRTVAQARNAAYQALVGLHGGPLLRRRFEVGFDHALRLWPRLSWACRQAGILTPGETAAALVLWMRAPHLDRTSMAPQSWHAGSEAVSHIGGTGNLLRAAKRWRRLFVTAPAARDGHGVSPQDPVHTGDQPDWWFDPQGGTYYPSRRSAAMRLPTGRYVLPSAAPTGD